MKRKYWLLTDTHLSHEEIKGYCKRPDDFEDKIFKGILNAQMKTGDVFIHLGDICIGNDAENNYQICDHVPKGVRKILVRGNHDRKSNNWYLDHGWDFVCEEFKTTLYGKKLVFTHQPNQLIMWNEINIHGHFHNNKHRGEEIGPHHKLLAIEYTNYQPVNLEKFLK